MLRKPCLFFIYWPVSRIIRNHRTAATIIIIAMIQESGVLLAGLRCEWYIRGPDGGEGRREPEQGEGIAGRVP